MGKIMNYVEVDVTVCVLGYVGCDVSVMCLN